jgi:hypothetical protein
MSGANAAYLSALVAGIKLNAVPQKREPDVNKRRIRLEEDIYTVTAEVMPTSVQCNKCWGYIRFVHPTTSSYQFSS